MFVLTAVSKTRLSTCDLKLQKLVETVVERYGIPVQVIEGHRGKEAQQAAVKRKASTVQWPLSKHNSLPSQAVDIAPMRWEAKTRKWEIDWNDHGSFGVLAGLMIATAKEMGISIRWGADWDGDFDLREHALRDGPHFELVEV